jgi:hypothetical protein
MSKEPYPGIDYSGPGATCNRDAETGIRYGVISCNSVGEGLYEAQEMDYGRPEEMECPDCEQAFPVACEWGDGVTCPHCGEGQVVDLPDMVEPCGWYVDDGEYLISNCLDNDAMIIKSPYYTYAQFCSPCVPGAGNLDNPYEPHGHAKEQIALVRHIAPNAEGEAFKSHAEEAGFVKTFCLGWDWFDEHSPCPYPAIFRVEDGEPVPRPSVD